MSPKIENAIYRRASKSYSGTGDELYISLMDLATILDDCKDTLNFTEAMYLRRLQHNLEGVHLAEISESVCFVRDMASGHPVTA